MKVYHWAETAVEDAPDDWVPAGVALQLRDALLALMDDGVWINDEWVPSEEAYAKADAAIKATEGT